MWFRWKSHSGTIYRHCSPLLSHDSNNDQNLEIHLAFDPSTVKASNHKMNGQIQDLKTATILCFSNSPNQTSESSTDLETAYEPMQHPPTRHRDHPSTIEMNDPTAKEVLQDEPNNSRSIKYNLRLNTNPACSDIYNC